MIEAKSIPDIVTLAMSDTVVNVGQLTKEEIRALENAVKQGLLTKVRYYGYPVPKWRYIPKPD